MNDEAGPQSLEPLKVDRDFMKVAAPTSLFSLKLVKSVGGGANSP